MVNHIDIENYDAISQRWTEAELAFNKGDLAGALFIFRKLAQEGLELAYVEIGNIYELGGGGVEQDISKAIKWYKRSTNSDAEHVNAHLALGRLYLQSEREKDHQKAKFHFKQVQQTEMGAQYGLGIIYERGLGNAVDTKRAIIHYQKAAEMGHIRARGCLEKLLVKRGPFRTIRGWIKSNLIVAKLIKQDPSIKSNDHPRLGISTNQ